MKFKFIISKWANFYLFVSNLSEWHFSVRKNYNITWREEFGKFSDEEENAIKQFKEIRQNYNTSKTFFEEAFFIAKNPFDILQKHLPITEYDIIKQIFSTLESKFNILYNEDLLLLEKWQEELINKISNSSLTNSITNTLAMLYDISIPEKEVAIYILLSGAEQTGGGANIDNKSIILEVSRYPLEKINHALGIIWHEIIHLVFQGNFYKLLLTFSPTDKKTADFINELVVSSLFPRGILGIRLLNTSPAIKLSSQINETQTINIINLTKIYIDQNKPFDNDFINKLNMLLKINNILIKKLHR